MMDHQQLEEYNNAQRIEILCFKWTESEKDGCDLYPGKDGTNKAAFDWIRRYAPTYRIFWVRMYPRGH